MNKIVRLGTAKTFRGRTYSIYCKIELRDGHLSITGVEGPLPSGNALGGCGQIDTHLNPDDITPAPGWSRDLIARFLAVWDRWHLNDMRAGSPAQMAWLRDHEDKRPSLLNLDYYSWAKEALTAASLNPDPNYLHDGKPYSYGSAWLREDTPAEVVDFLASLPDTDKTPAWV